MISWDEDYPQLHIDTSSEAMYHKLLKLGYKIVSQDHHHTVFTAPLRALTFNKVVTHLESSPDPLKQGLSMDAGSLGTYGRQKGEQR